MNIVSKSDSLIITEEELEIIHEIEKEIQSIGITCEIDRQPLNLDNFFLYENYKKYKPFRILRIRANNCTCYLTFIKGEYISTKQGSKTHYLEKEFQFQNWGICTLKRNFGRVILRKEKFADKISEILKPVEFDFKEDKFFSDKVYMLVDDEDLIKLNFSKSYRDMIRNLDLEDYHIEIIDRQLIISTGQKINYKDSLKLCEFLLQMSKI
jgi:hypothetical protein